MASTTSQANVRELVKAHHPGLIELRHALHRIPEVMHEEKQTSLLIQSELTALGIAFVADLGGHEPGTGTGVVAHLPAVKDGERIETDLESVGLRADMDALPITETTGVEYASTNPGVMHACGHDGHMTTVLGAARILAAMPDRPNPVTLVFQPAEEGGFGGEYMVRDGCLEGAARLGEGMGPRVGRMYGMHGWPERPLGTVCTRGGAFMASTDEFTMSIVGKGGHGAYPHLCIDPVLATAGVIQAVQRIVSRNVKPMNPAVVTIASVHGGHANNVIPDEIVLNGTLRAIDAETRRLLEVEFIRVVTSTAEAYRCEARIRWEPGYPVVRNDEAEALRVLRIAGEAFGADWARTEPEPTMGGEDFAYYCDQVPSCFFWVGLGEKGDDGRDDGGGGSEKEPLLHQSRFDFKDAAIPVGVEMMVRLALDA
ncbi:MAG: amidohydrolase [Phycisphaerales bacterium]|jgi:amidohydrolase